MKLSLFEHFQTELQHKIVTIHLTKITLVHISHTLEDIVLRRKLPAMLFTGFQESSHWRKETQRYRELAELAQQVTIFAGQPLPEDSAANALQIALEGDDPLRQEWFLAILCTEFSVVLCGQDRLVSDVPEAMRTFDTIWTFDYAVVSDVLALLERVVQRYRPDMLPELQAARQQFPPVVPSTEMLTNLATRIIRFEDQLHGELRRSQDELDSNVALYRALAQNAPVALITFDEHGILRAAEGHHKAALLADAEHPEGESIFELFPRKPVLLESFRRALTGERVSEITHEFDGFAFEVLCTPFQNEAERYDGVIAVFVDITEREQAQQRQLEVERLRIEVEKERELGELRKRLMMTISHELRTPLATIQTSSEMLDQYFDRLTAEQRTQRLHTILAQVERLSRLLEDVNFLVRTETMYGVVTPEQVNVHALIQNFINDQTGFYPTVSVTLEADDDAQHLEVDTRLLEYIVSNLLSNAMKYTESVGTVRVLLQRQDDQLHLTVIDQGIGIPLAEQKRVLEPFYRGSNATIVDGTGLGLTIIQHCVELYEGSMTLESEVGHGTTVVVTLPLLSAR